MNGTEQRIRIGVFTKPLDNWNSGSGHHLDELMKAVLDLNDAEGKPFDFTFIHYAKSDNAIYRRVNELIIPRNPISASGVLRKKKFDIVHYAPLTAYAPIWGIKAKKLATVHGIEEVLYPAGYSFFQRFHANYILPVLLRKKDGVATVSQTSKNYFSEHYGVNPEKIFITTNGYSPEYHVLSGAEKNLPATFGISKPFILHISRYSLRKNPVAILKGFARLIENTGLDYELVCAGKGWDGEEARLIARNEGIAERYRAPGFISEQDAVQLLNHAQAFLFPSFAEGFGMPNIEAMACGCPVVTSGIFAIPEVVGDAAIIVSKPDDTGGIAEAIAQIVRSPQTRKDLVERGVSRCTRYNWQVSARALIDGWKRTLRNT